MSTLVTVFQSSNSVEVYHKKALLVDQGIQSIIEDEHTNQWFWHLSNAIGGIKLKVLEEHQDKAIEIIFDKPIEKSHCPKCDSTNIYFDQYYKSASIFLSLLLALIPIPIYKNQWTCRDCKHIWKGGK